MNRVKSRADLRENIGFMIKCNPKIFPVDFASWLWLLRTSFSKFDVEYKFIERVVDVVKEEYRKEYDENLYKGEFKNEKITRE